MSTPNVQSLSGAEFCAMAHHVFGQNDFAAKDLVPTVGRYLRTSVIGMFRPRALEGIAAATEAGLFEECTGPRGGRRLKLTPLGIASADTVELPPHFVSPKVDFDLLEEAPESAGAAALRILAAIDGNDLSAARDRTFVVQLLEFWLKYKRLSEKQAYALAKRGEANGLQLRAADLVGKASAAHLEEYSRHVPSLEELLQTPEASRQSHRRPPSLTLVASGTKSPTEKS